MEFIFASISHIYGLTTVAGVKCGYQSIQMLSSSCDQSFYKSNRHYLMNSLLAVECWLKLSGEDTSIFCKLEYVQKFSVCSCYASCMRVLSSLSPDLLHNFIVSLLYLCYNVFSHYLHFSPYSEKLLNYLLYHCTQVFKQNLFKFLFLKVLVKSKKK